MAGLNVANLGLAFALELCALATFGYWGFRTGSSLLLKSVLGLGVPLFVAVFWGIFLSPKAVVPLAKFLKLILQPLVFALAAAALYSAGKPVLALVFGLVVVINQVLLFVWKQGT
jgi:Protein of unknown function (DUF2568)